MREDTDIDQWTEKGESLYFCASWGEKSTLDKTGEYLTKLGRILDKTGAKKHRILDKSWAKTPDQTRPAFYFQFVHKKPEKNV